MYLKLIWGNVKKNIVLIYENKISLIPYKFWLMTAWRNNPLLKFYYWAHYYQFLSMLRVLENVWPVFCFTTQYGLMSTSLETVSHRVTAAAPEIPSRGPRNIAIIKLLSITRKSSCVNARGIPTAAYQVLHLLSCTGYLAGVSPCPRLDGDTPCPRLDGVSPGLNLAGYPPPPSKVGWGYPQGWTN